MTKLLNLLVALLVSSCASKQTAEEQRKHHLAPGSRVGVAVILDSGFEHQHVGALIFDNYDGTIPVPLDLHKSAQTGFFEAIRERGLVPVAIAPESVTRSGLFTAERGVRTTVRDPTNALVSLTKEYQLSALVAVVGTRTVGYSACVSLNCRTMARSGLFTVGMIENPYITSVVPAFEVKVFLANPTQEISRFDPLASINRDRSKDYREYPRPVNVKALSPDELQFVASKLKLHLDTAKEAAMSLIASPSSGRTQ